MVRLFPQSQLCSDMGDDDRGANSIRALQLMTSAANMRRYKQATRTHFILEV
jgi:hypothetical protein